jgi:hypothetical protein
MVFQTFFGPARLRGATLEVLNITPPGPENGGSSGGTPISFVYFLGIVDKVIMMG